MHGEKGVMALLHLLLTLCNPSPALRAAADPEQAHGLNKPSCASSSDHYTSPDPVLWPGQLRTTVVRGDLFLTPCSEIIFLPWSVKTELLIIFITASQSAGAILAHINV